MQELLDAVGAEAEASRKGLQFNATKCDGKKRTTFQIHNGTPVVMSEEYHYKYLGIPTGYSPFVDPRTTTEEMKRTLDNIDNSLLAPWQKLESVVVFLIPKLSFLIKSGFVEKGPLDELDNKIMDLAKKWTANRPNASTEDYYYFPYRQGGLSLFPIKILADIATVAQADKFLSSTDAKIQELARTGLTAAKAKIGRDPSPEEVCGYLNGETRGIFDRSSDEGTSFWARARESTRLLRTKINLQWTPDKSDRHPLLLTEGSSQWTAESRLKDSFRRKFLRSLLEKKDQGKVYASTIQSPYSSHFMREGNLTRFTDWKFIFKARLNLQVDSPTPVSRPTRQSEEADQSELHHPPHHQPGTPRPSGNRRGGQEDHHGRRDGRV